jgi:Mg2+/Co2+ transporter CorC
MRGYITLKETTRKRTATLKHLVKDNFDRFISCKDTIDHVYGELIAKGLLKDALGAANCEIAVKSTDWVY